MASAPPNKPLTGDGFQRKPKKIFMAPMFRDLTGEAGEEPYVSNLLEFRRRTEQGWSCLRAFIGTASANRRMTC